MALFPEIDFEKAAADAEKVLHTPLGFASPLWMAYAGAASAGLTFWWMNQWMKPANLEGMTSLLGKYSPAPMPELWPAKLPAVAAQAMAAAPAAAVETLADITPEPGSLAAALEPQLDAAKVEQVVAPKAMEAAADDLTRLVGIGPTLAGKLYDLGVRSYAEIASWTQSDLEEVDRKLNLLGRASRDNWIGQARQLADMTAH